MSWVSQANIKTIMTAIRNKFTTSDLVIANDAKDTGVELNYASQDGLVTVSPISTSASTEAALHLSNGDDTKKTELTQGTLSYVTGTGSSETYNYMSLLGDGVTFGKNGGGNVQLGGVADPTSAQQVATKNYVDNKTAGAKYFVNATTYEVEPDTYSDHPSNEYGYDKSGYTLAAGEPFRIPKYRTISGVKYEFVSLLSITGVTNAQYSKSYYVPLSCIYAYGDFTFVESGDYIEASTPDIRFNSYETFTGYGFKAVVTCLYKEV